MTGPGICLGAKAPAGEVTMALDFNLLKTPDLGAQFNAGREVVQNQLVKQQQMQMQREQMRGLADDRAAQAEDRRAQADVRRQQLMDAQVKAGQLKAIEDEFQRNGQQLTPSIAMKMIGSGHPVYAQIGTKAIEGYQSRQLLSSIMGGEAGAPAPAMPQGQPMAMADAGQPRMMTVADRPAAPANNLAPAPQNTLSPSFDIPAVQAKITRLLATGDPALERVANGLQSQLTAEQTRQNQLRTDERMRMQHQESLADRREARAQAEALRRELRAGRGDGEGTGGAGKGVQQVEDPKNPGQVILVTNAEAASGKYRPAKQLNIDTKQTQAEKKKTDGQEQVVGIIDNLRASYDELNRMRAIPSTERGALSNIGSSIGASGIGQFAGRTVGSDPQRHRDVISSSRIQLLNGIKQATGMSAQQLNSNMELKTWLDAVTDPKQSIQTVNQILDNIEGFVTKNAQGASAKPGKPGKPDPNAVDTSNPLLK
jgi:hypothetical protein